MGGASGVQRSTDVLDCLGLLLRWRHRVDVVEGLLIARLHRLELGAVGILTYSLGPLRPARPGSGPSKP